MAIHHHLVLAAAFLLAVGCQTRTEQRGEIESAAPEATKVDVASRFEPGPNAITFESMGETIVGTLFMPAGATPERPVPVVIIDGPWTQVKEQVGYQYARRFPDLGLAALAIDHRYWGKSGGEPRHFESTSAKVEDLQAAISFLEGVPEVGRGTALLGVCAGAGNVALTAATDDRVKAVATVAAWLQHPSTTPLFYGGAEGIAQRVQSAERAIAAFEETGEMNYVAAYDPAENSGAAMFFPSEYYGSAARGRVPAWDNSFAVAGWKEWLELNVIDGVAERIKAPVLMVHSDGSALPDNVKRFYDALPSPKTLVWAEGEHTGFYDQDTLVAFATNAVGRFFMAVIQPDVLAGSASERDAPRSMR